MNIYLGIDIGSVSIQAALVLEGPSADGLSSAGMAVDGVLQEVALPDASDRAVFVTHYRRTRGRPMEALRSLLGEVFQCVDADLVRGLMLTGSGSQLLARAIGVSRCNEFQAIARAVDWLHPRAQSVFEMGGESSKYLRLSPDAGSGELGIADYSANGDCAAGTGAFLDQQAGRLKYAVEDIGSIVEGADRAAQIAGRCSVFAKSDMIHAQQKGFGPAEVLRGLCKAVATNYKSAVVKGREPRAPVLLLGGVSSNSAVVRELRDVFGLDEESLQVPEVAASFPAIGAAITAARSDAKQSDGVKTLLTRLQDCSQSESSKTFATSAPLTLNRVKLLRSQVEDYDFGGNGDVVDAYLGLDIGSVGTKLVVIDHNGDVVHHIFTRTEGRPIEVITRCLLELESAVGSRVRILGVGTTGSGRELIGELVGADSINDEITCHKTGATFIGDRLLGKRPDTIFEIGGQDSKYISLEPEGGESRDTIVVDFTMNEACAAGTGSFLEERAEELGVSIKDEFSREAFASRAPIKLGERCTVFMERDVNTCMQRGARRSDVIAGLAYSVVYNYINRVVRGRRIGNCIFFQGGTAYNDAVAAAFSAVTGKEIIVPPHNVVLGAIGAALLAKEKVAAAHAPTRFRGYHMEKVNYSLREFICKGCGNHCSVQEFNVEGEKTYWGDKCSDRYRKHAKTDRKPVIEDLVGLRKQLLHADDASDLDTATVTIGIPLALYTHDLLPLWRRFFRDCGFKVEVSSETNRKIVQLGYDNVVAEPCFPIIVAHGHVAELIDKKVDYIWLPNVLSAESDFTDNSCYCCPWGQTLPFVVRQAAAFQSWGDRILCPTLRLHEGREPLRQELVAMVEQMGVKRAVAEKAFSAGWSALQEFRTAYHAAGREALTRLTQRGESGIVVVGRPYNIHDPGVTLSVARKLRDHYGVNVLPIDALPLGDIDIRDVNDNMFWEYGRRILAAAKWLAAYPNLHMIYVTNFKCGPDSFVKSFVRSASGKPFLSLQFDGHSNDAGIMTRCEAYLDSKGILRWWRTCKKKPADKVSVGERSISPKWPMPGPGSLPRPFVASGSTRQSHQTPTSKH